METERSVSDTGKGRAARTQRLERQRPHYKRNVYGFLSRHAVVYGVMRLSSAMQFSVQPSLDDSSYLSSCHLLPALSLGALLPPGQHIGVLLKSATEPYVNCHLSIRQVVDISEREYISSDILLPRQEHIVHIQSRIKLRRIFGNNDFIGLPCTVIPIFQ